MLSAGIRSESYPGEIPYLQGDIEIQAIIFIIVGPDKCHYELKPILGRAKKIAYSHWKKLSQLKQLCKM
jgi:hypothetical protein